MNRPCDQCGRIITVPDIPLPAGYTQKCTACGYANKISDGLEPPQTSAGGKSFASAEESWSGSFDSTMGFAGDEKSAPPGMEDRFRELEARLRAEMEQALAAGGGKLSVPQQPHGLTHPMVTPKEVLVGTKNTAIYHKCFSLLSEAGYRVEGAGDLNKAYEMIRARHFQILVLDQQFLNSGEAGRQIFQHIRETPVDIRRVQTVLLLTPGIASSEPQVFYQWGMDLNIHPRDLDSLGTLLRRHLNYKNRILAPLGSVPTS